MQISFDCPKCLQIAHGEVTSASRGVLCTACGWTRPVGESELDGETPRSCLVCGCGDLWRQKDFNPRLGVVIVGLTMLIYLILAGVFMMPVIAMVVLMVVGLADWLLYAVLPDRLVCYRCHAQYRRIPDLKPSPVFDLELNEKYRQEAIRLKRAEDARQK